MCLVPVQAEPRAYGRACTDGSGGKLRTNPSRTACMSTPCDLAGSSLRTCRKRPQAQLDGARRRGPAGIAAAARLERSRPWGKSAAASGGTLRTSATRTCGKPSACRRARRASSSEHTCWGAGRPKASAHGRRDTASRAGTHRRGTSCRCGSPSPLLPARPSFRTHRICPQGPPQHGASGLEGTP